MASGKYSRVDNRRSPGYCSTITVVVFVALCLVGVWMMTSSSLVPVQNPAVSLENKSEVGTQGFEGNAESSSDGRDNENSNNNIEDGGRGDEGKQNQFEDNQGDLPEDAIKEDSNVNSNQVERRDIPEEMEKNKEKFSFGTKDDVAENKEDGPKDDAGSGVENKEDGPKDVPEIREQKKDDGEPQVENTRSETVETTENNSKDNEKRTEEYLGNTDSEKQEDKMVEKLENTMPELSSVKGIDKPSEVIPSVAHSELLNEPTTQSGSFPTQASQSKNEKASRKSSSSKNPINYVWKVCKTTAGPDYIPCLDNYEAIKKLPTNKHYEHRERHCPSNPPTCLVPLPGAYQSSIEWPKSREKIWYHNVPHTLLAEFKGHQNWVKVSGEYLTFPGGGTQFKHGALHYIDLIQQSVPEIAWGKRTRVILDVGCGVASFGGYLFDRDALTMSLAPKDEHEAQVQFALERGIPAISAVMGTKRLPFPGRVFDAVHCARCRVPWHIEGGKLLLELNRLLRPGGFFVWSATPIYQKLPDDVEIWEAMKKLTKAMCWEVVSITKDRLNKVGIAVYRKPSTNECYEQRPENDPPLCQDSDDPNAAWNVPLEACMHKLPAPSERGSEWPEEWPARVEKVPFWLSNSETGVYGKPAPDDFESDYQHWKRVVKNSYLQGLGINWASVRNVMDMRAVYGGLAAALRELNVWVMNIVNIEAGDTLPIIFERGLFGMYHDWCESFSTYPRTYDLLHADHLFSKIKSKCSFIGLVVEVDRMLRPEGKIIIRDSVETLNELEDLLKSLKWDIRIIHSNKKEGLIFAQKSMWRPKAEETLAYAIES